MPAPAHPHVALVTGASGGLGAAMADALARKGWLVFAASRSARSDAGGDLVDGHVEPLFMDVTQESSICAALARISERGLDIDLLINNAGINASGVVEEMPRQQGRLARGAVDIPATCADYDNVRAALKQHWARAIDAGMPVNDMAGRIINWALTGRSFRKRFGQDAVWVPIAKQAMPEAIFFSVTRRKFGI